MAFINWIIEDFNKASDFFYSIYLEVYGWVYPFWLAADFFYSVSRVFNWLAWDFYDFGVWVDATANKLLEILSWDTITSYLLSWLPNLDALNTWFYHWWGNVTSAITSWWSSTQYLVKGWIAAGQQWLQDQLDSLSSLLVSLQSQISYLLDQLPSINEIIAWFSTWWANILASLIAWGALTATQISSLIDSAFTSREPFWAGWQDIKDSVIEFFADPWGWFYDRAEDLFDRFW